MGYAKTKVLSDIIPTSPVEVWVAAKVLCLPPGLIQHHQDNIPGLVYEAMHSIKPSPVKELRTFNSTRVDLAAELVDIPSTDLPVTVRIPYSPKWRDPAWWLLRYVYAFTEREIELLCGPHHPRRLRGKAIDTLLEILRVNPQINDPLLRAYFVAKRELLKYYLEVVYHLR